MEEEVARMTHPFREVDEAIGYIHQHLHEPLTLSQLARHVSYSPYHFTRMFKKRMGLSPLYYVSSLRLQRAKDLLLHTSFSIRDIAMEIGQQSVGTFTTRFRERVGITPSQFRHSSRHADHLLDHLRQLNDWSITLPSTTHPRLEGNVHTTAPLNGFVLIGLFSKPIPEGLPLYGTLVPFPGSFCIPDVKPGSYYLMATSVSWEMQAMDFLLPHTTLRTRSKTPLIVQSDAPIPHQQVTLHPPRLDDPPILISLPLLMNRFLSRMGKEATSLLT
jgi:AraC family transcriptional regulator